MNFCGRDCSQASNPSMRVSIEPRLTNNPMTAPTRKRTLLIVDDDEGPRKSLELIFHNAYNVVAASNGPDALELLKVQAVDVAILDIRMAGMSGIELLEHLKAADPSIEAMMLTGY